MAATGPAGGRQGARDAGRRQRRAAGALKTHARRRTPCVWRAATPTPPALGAMFGALSRVETGLRTRHDRHHQPVRHLAAGPDAVGRGLEPDQDRRAGRAADGLRGLPHAVGAQGHRLDADSPRAQPRRPLRPADADRRCGQADLQGDHPPDRGQQGLVLPRPGDDHHAGAGGLGGDSLRPRSGAGQHQRRPAVPDGDHLARGLRRDHRRLGLELEVRLPRRAARIGADGELRDRDGLRAGGRADGVGQHEHDRHRDGPGPRARSPTWG